ncbi:uncharacterized protein BJ171DRAFT_525024 [Polychytrium aggregatum]|uniref:uncharacterized protein n=1 Tax=Polychytrium aggregatum TaxID=110093 RepID=UPI0022FF37D5|nr:uncharacterized protein BJ171DRAFT_525024 [Polychytrium aggregatum]KAI9193553.1 hypothetical protein BJ171DRAFT_525024 [Polychytrium aggregatum]
MARSSPSPLARLIASAISDMQFHSLSISRWLVAVAVLCSATATVWAQPHEYPNIQSLVGKKLLQPAQSPDDLIAQGFARDQLVSVDSLPPKYRILLPNSVVTMDYWADRANIHIDNNWYITSIVWG